MELGSPISRSLSPDSSYCPKCTFSLSNFRNKYKDSAFLCQKMKVKRKNNVYPFFLSSRPPLSPSSSHSLYKDPDSVLKLLPVAILALAFSLPNHDREVLAYLIARSILTTINTTFKNPNSSINTTSQRPKNKCRTTISDGRTNCTKKMPLFECGCFDCYTSFWYRWDSSPNRVLIHQVIDAFEEHLLQNEHPRKRNRGKKRVNGNIDKVVLGSTAVVESHIQVAKSQILMPEEVMTPENVEGGGDVEENGGVYEEEEEEKMSEVKANLEMEVLTVQSVGAQANHKGLGRKVFPDVVGLLNSRLWSFWSPGI